MNRRIGGRNFGKLVANLDQPQGIIA